MSEINLGKEWERYKELVEERPELFVDNGEIHIVLDEDIVAGFEMKTAKKVGVVYESPYSMMVVDLVYENSEEYFLYERVIPAVSSGAVVTIPIYKGKVLLLKQYRHAIRDYQYSLPRGFGEKGLSVEENARKELREEIGAKVGNIFELGTLTPDSGAQSTTVSVCKCEVSSYTPETHSEGICDIIELEIGELAKWIAKGKITDGFTLAAHILLLTKDKDI